MKRRVMAVAAATVAAAASLALALGGSGYSTFQAATSPIASPISTASITLGLEGTGASNSLTVGATNIVPGDSMAREVVLADTGSAGIGTITLAVSSPSNNLLVKASGLQVAVQTCSTTWTATSLPDGGYAYSCSSTTSTLVSAQPVASLSSIVLPGISLTPDHPQAIVVTATLPSSAGNSYQGLSATLDYIFTATQSPGGAV